MNPKLQAELLAVCFIGQTGYCPQHSTPEIASGYGYVLHWDKSKVIDTDTDREARFRIAVEKLKQAKPPKQKRMSDLDKLAEELDVFSDYDKDSYHKIEYEELKVIPNKKAVLIDGHWIAKSQMKVDSDSNLYVSEWLYRKEFGK